MSTANRAAVLGKIHKVLKKHYKLVAPAAGRTVLENLLFSAVLENTDFETAEELFAKLQEGFFDWNELRVTTIAELAEVMAALPDSTDAAHRLKKVLQAVFETHYQFDLEALKKQNLGKSISDLEKFPGISAFMVAYVTQNALAGHAIALSRGAWDALLAVAAASEQDYAKQHLTGMERAIPKNKGAEFFSLLHQFGIDLASSPQSSRVKGILAEIDAEAKERFSHWQIRKVEIAKKEAQDAANAKRKAAEEARAAVQDSKKKPSKSETEKPTKGGKSAELKSAEGKSSDKKSETKSSKSEKEKLEKAKEHHKAIESSKKERSKHLTKRKPK